MVDDLSRLPINGGGEMSELYWRFSEEGNSSGFLKAARHWSYSHHYSDKVAINAIAFHEANSSSGILLQQ